MYSIKDLSLICGLSERSLRNYLKLGVLQGNKENGVWKFSVEQIDAFLNNDYVKPAIQANRKSIVYDFLNSTQKEQNTACIILDLPKENSMKLSLFLCDAVNKRTGLNMTFDIRKGSNRVILVGNEKTVFEILQEYHSKF